MSFALLYDNNFRDTGQPGSLMGYVLNNDGNMEWKHHNEQW